MKRTPACSLIQQPEPGWYTITVNFNGQFPLRVPSFGVTLRMAKQPTLVHLLLVKLSNMHVALVGYQWWHRWGKRTCSRPRPDYEADLQDGNLVKENREEYDANLNEARHYADQILLKCMTSWSLSTSFHVNECFDSLLARDERFFLLFSLTQEWQQTPLHWKIMV